MGNYFAPELGLGFQNFVSYYYSESLLFGRPLTSIIILPVSFSVRGKECAKGYSTFLQAPSRYRVKLNLVEKFLGNAPAKDFRNRSAGSRHNQRTGESRMQNLFHL
jgi:hypothetical protein